MNKQQLLGRLLDRARFGAKLSLGRMHQALAFLGSPQESFPCVHIAGTNGKGSVCAMLEAIFSRAGLRTGLYTSPHLCRYNERIRIAGQEIDDAALCQALAEVLLPLPLADLTFFEVMTLAAFLAMRRAAVDLAILEVGLGGRWDATNVVSHPLCTAVTSIGVDHARELGHDIAAIAREKAGILKPESPWVIGPLPAEAARVVQQVAVETGAAAGWCVRPAGRLGPDLPAVTYRGDAAGSARQPHLLPGLRQQQVSISCPDGHQLSARVALAGPHQLANAAVACGVIRRVASSWPGHELSEAIAGGLEHCRWPGRLETIAWRSAAGGRRAKELTVVLDCAHNLPATEALVRSLPGLDPSSTTLVFAALGDKPVEAMLAELSPVAQRRIYTVPGVSAGNRAAVSPERLAQLAPGTAVADPRAAITRATQTARPGDTILVTGSIFLVGLARAELLGLAQDGRVAL